jgi:spore germination protein GerM
VSFSRRWLATVLVAGLGVAGCNLPTDRTATVFNDSPTASSCTGPISVTIYLVDTTAKPEHLTPVTRRNAAKNGDAPLCALNALNAGPTVDEQIKGIETRFLEIPEGLGLNDVSSGTATVQLDPAFLSIVSQKSLAEAFGQIVYTLTGLNVGISHVGFIFDNRPFPGVVLPNGKMRTNGVVSRSDYCSIGPPGQRCGAT